MTDEPVEYDRAEARTEGKQHLWQWVKIILDKADREGGGVTFKPEDGDSHTVTVNTGRMITMAPTEVNKADTNGMRDAAQQLVDELDSNNVRYTKLSLVIGPGATQPFYPSEQNPSGGAAEQDGAPEFDPRQHEQMK